jgi:hypothetical protein
MPEMLTRRKTPQSVPAGWSDSFRNGGRHQNGTLAGFASESLAGFNWNPHLMCLLTQ